MTETQKQAIKKSQLENRKKEIDEYEAYNHGLSDDPDWDAIEKAARERKAQHDRWNEGYVSDPLGYGTDIDRNKKIERLNKWNSQVNGKLDQKEINTLESIAAKEEEESRKRVREIAQRLESGQGAFQNKSIGDLLTDNVELKREMHKK